MIHVYPVTKYTLIPAFKRQFLHRIPVDEILLVVYIYSAITVPGEKDEIQFPTACNASLARWLSLSLTLDAFTSVFEQCI